MKQKTFNNFWDKETVENLVAVINAVKKEIDDDMIQEGGDEPSIQITISTDRACGQWSYQTGDNCYSGSCYGDPYWGVGRIHRDTDASELVRELIEDLANQIDFED